MWLLGLNATGVHPLTDVKGQYLANPTSALCNNVIPVHGGTRGTTSSLRSNVRLYLLET
jgi:hypothetical protein